MMGANPTICELDPRQSYLDKGVLPCDGPPTEEFRQVNTRRRGKVEPLPQPGVWGARCNRHGKLVDRKLNESRRID